MRQGTRPRGKLLAPAHLVTAQQSLTAALLKGRIRFPKRTGHRPAAIRAGPNRRIFFWFFGGRCFPATRRRGREFLEFWSFFSFFVCFPWELVSGRGLFL
jgi:hypothetical protein